jgi:molybdopterin-binding protein
MQTSARNQLSGTITSMRLGDIMAQVETAVGDNRVTAVITRESAEEMDLKEGDAVVAIIKSTEIMVGKTES